LSYFCQSTASELLNYTYSLAYEVFLQTNGLLCKKALVTLKAGDNRIDHGFITWGSRTPNPKSLKHPNQGVEYLFVRGEYESKQYH